MTTKEKVIKERPQQAVRADDPITKRSIWFNWFHYIYFGLVSTDLLIEYFSHTILIPTKILFSLVLIYETVGQVKKAFQNNKISVHGILLIISLAASLGGDAFAIYSKSLIKFGLSMGLYITSRLVLALIYLFHVYISDVNSGIESILPAVAVPGIFTGVILVIISQDLDSDFGLTLVFLLMSAAACGSALMCRLHLKGSVFLRVAIGTFLLMAYDGIYLIARMKDWQKRHYYTPLMFVNYLAWYLISQGGISAIKYYDVENRKNMTQSVIKPARKIE